MKKIYKKAIAIITLTLFGFGSYAQDSTAFVAADNLNAVDYVPKFAVIPTQGSNLNLTGNWTIEAWINIGVSSGKNSIVETYTGGNTGGFALRVTSGKLVAYQIDNGTFALDHILDTADLDLNTWYHVAATLDESAFELKIYVDGVLHGVKGTSIKTYNNNPVLRIGALGDDDVVQGKTAIDEVRIWNEAKSQEEIEALADSCLSGNEANLLAWYNFEDVSDSNLIDKSGNGNDGIFENFNPLSFTEGVSCTPSTPGPGPSGIEDVSAEFNLAIYPNPARNMLTIELEEQVEMITVMNLEGRVENIVRPSNNRLDVSHLKNGLHFLIIQTDRGLVRTKFMKE